jgi:hypothetical protein
MDAWIDKVKIAMIMLAVAVTVAVAVVATPRAPGNDAGSRTVAIVTHHGTQHTHVILLGPTVTATAEPTNTLSGDVKYRGESLG